MDKKFNKLALIEVNGRFEPYKHIVIDGNITDYLVTIYGNIISLKNNMYRILSPSISKKGYCYVCLKTKDGSNTYRVHRLVANAFISNPNNKPEVNHIDGNKLNNNVYNLEWVTHDENMKHASKSNLMAHTCGEKSGNSHYKTEQIHLVCKMLEDNNKSINEISEITKVSKMTILHIRHHRTWKHISKLYNIDNYYTDKYRSRYSKVYKKKTIDELFNLIKEGKSNKEIMKKLNLPNSQKTRTLIYESRKKVNSIL